jgi:hypothetical protein
MFTELYLQTTDPTLPISSFFTPTTIRNIILSTIFHTIIYTAFANLVSYIFLGRPLTQIVNIRLLTALFVIMFFGYFARILHVREIYTAYGRNKEKTRQHVDRLYIGWIFIG